MNFSSGRSLLYYRLIALWVICEAMLGGIIHGFKLPVSGLFVGSCAVICIILIAWYLPWRGSVISATIIVAVFKMMLSPQAPPTAYIAVFFQGILGELLLRNRKWFRLSCILFAVLALLESGLQRILVLTIIYGNDVWKVVNDFFSGIFKNKNATNYSFIIGSVYVGLHVLAGFLAGWWGGSIPSRINEWDKNLLPLPETHSTVEIRSVKRKKRFIILIGIWIILLLYAQSYYSIGKPLLPTHVSLKIFLRSVIIVLAWYLFVAPLLLKFLYKWLRKRKEKNKETIQNILEILPSSRELIRAGWDQSIHYKGISRVMATIRFVLSHTIHVSPVYFYSGAVQTGKTSRLMEWARDRNDVYGILTPIVDGKRVFMNAHTRETFPMEMFRSEEDALVVGKYVFSKESFNKAELILRESLYKGGVIIIDEIGPLELKEKGFHNITREIISNLKDDQKVVIVVREQLLDTVKMNYGLRAIRN